MHDGTRSQQLVRGLGPVQATALVVGIVVGTGVFLKGAIITQLTGSPGMALAAWTTAGLLSLAGALTYAELGAMLPSAGGEYVILREAYGDLVAFGFGWMRIIVGATSTAAVATSFATFLGSLTGARPPWVVVDGRLLGHLAHWQFGPPQVAAIAALAVIMSINCAGVVAGGRTQVVLATVKVAAVLVIIGGVLAVAPIGRWVSGLAGTLPTGSARHTLSAVATAGGTGPAPGAPVPGSPAAFGAAVVAALWAYTGWSYLPNSAGEIRDPGRTLPRAIVSGTVLVMVLYVALNAAYFIALPVDAVAAANSTRYPDAPALATRAVATLLGTGAGRAMTIVFLVSALGTLNGAMLTSPRVPFAMARAGQFFPAFGSVGRRSRAPTFAIVCIAACAALMAASGTYDQLTDLVVFTYAVFYAFTGLALFVLRHRMPDRPRPYRVFGYPVVTLAFVIASVGLIVAMLRANPLVAWLALALLALGLPAYGYFRRQMIGRDAYVSTSSS